jgi:tripeptidyl-peptidase-2
LFSVPITVIRPLPTKSVIKLGRLEFEPAEIKRFFVVPPPGATWMDLTLRDGRDEFADDNDHRCASRDGSSRTIAVHTVQILPHKAFRQHECNRRLDILPGQIHAFSVAVEHSVTCEVALARYWSTRGPTVLSEASIRFRGLRPVPDEIHLVAGSGGAMIRVHSDLNTESLLATAKLTRWQTPLRPMSSLSTSSNNGGSSSTNPIISPLFEDDRDQIYESDKKMYQLVLTYEFEQEEKGSFIPRAPALNEVLYESGWESQCMLIFDGEKKYLGMSGAHPSTIQASKGTVVIRLQIRHDDPTKLEKLQDLVIWIERSLSKDIVLTAYGRRDEMMLGKNPLKKRTLRKGTSAPAGPYPCRTL